MDDSKIIINNLCIANRHSHAAVHRTIPLIKNDPRAIFYLDPRWYMKICLLFKLENYISGRASDGIASVQSNYSAAVSGLEAFYIKIPKYYFSYFGIFQTCLRQDIYTLVYKYIKLNAVFNNKTCVIIIATLLWNNPPYSHIRAQSDFQIFLKRNPKMVKFSK